MMQLVSKRQIERKLEYAFCSYMQECDNKSLVIVKHGASKLNSFIFIFSYILFIIRIEFYMCVPRRNVLCIEMCYTCEPL